MPGLALFVALILLALPAHSAAASAVPGEDQTCRARIEMKAVVLGGTGAIGRELVGQLLSSGNWSTVVTVGRREVAVPEAYTDLKGKLEQRTVSMDSMEQAADAFTGASAVFCALGTTRKDAGSAEAFKKVDYEYVARSAELAKQAGVPHFSLVSAQGANANVWASDFALLHPLLYTRTKGRAEEAVKAQGFQHASIFRPGLLDRGALMRGLERTFLSVVSNIKVADVARLMVLDAERAAAATAAAAAPSVAVFEMGQLMRAAKAGAAP